MRDHWHPTAMVRLIEVVGVDPPGQPEARAIDPDAATPGALVQVAIAGRWYEAIVQPRGRRAAAVTYVRIRAELEG